MEDVVLRSTPGSVVPEPTAERTGPVSIHPSSIANRVWSHTVSRPLSVLGACLAIYCDWSSILLDGIKNLVYRSRASHCVKTSS